MNYSLWIEGSQHTLAGGEANGGFWAMDGVPFAVDAREVAPRTYSLLIDGRSFLARIREGGEEFRQPGAVTQVEVEINGVFMPISIGDPRRRTSGGSGTLLTGIQKVTAPIPGKVVRVLVAEQQRVEAGESVAILEAMKMQNEIRSPKSGVVQALRIRTGQAVNAGEVLLNIE